MNGLTPERRYMQRSSIVHRTNLFVLGSVLAGLLLSASPPSFAGPPAVDPLKFSQVVEESQSNVYETDLSSPVDPNRPTIGTYKNNNGSWQLLIYGPIVWADDDGNLHEIESATGAWKKWLDSFGRKVVRRWTQLKQRPDENVSVGITLMNQPQPVNGLKFTPDEKAEAHPFTLMVQDITGISKGKAVGEILPADAKSANTLHLNMRFIRSEAKLASKKPAN